MLLKKYPGDQANIAAHIHRSLILEKCQLPNLRATGTLAGKISLAQLQHLFYKKKVSKLSCKVYYLLQITSEGLSNSPVCFSFACTTTGLQRGGFQDLSISTREAIPAQLPLP